MSESMTMIERVAREIARTQLARNYVDLARLEAAGVLGAGIEVDRVWPCFVPEARAAIEAMREPTSAALSEDKGKG